MNANKKNYDNNSQIKKQVDKTAILCSWTIKKILGYKKTPFCQTFCTV